MKSNPLFSIIIPVYNKEAYLEKCIESIVVQDTGNYEVLLINDGSKDKSGEICDNYSKRHSQIKVFHQKNQGVSAARNTGLNNASGEWIMFVDADDWVEPWILEDLDSQLKSLQAVDLIRCYPNKINLKGVASSPDLPDQVVLYKRDDFLKRGLLPGLVSSVIVTKKLVDKYNLRFNNDLGFQEDSEFNFRCVINSERILLYNKAFYNYFVNDDSTTSNLNFKKISDFLTSFQMMQAYAGNEKSIEVKRQLKRSLNNSIRMFTIESAANYVHSDIQAAKVRNALYQFLKKEDVKIREIHPYIQGLIVLALIHIGILFLIKKLIAYLKS